MSALHPLFQEIVEAHGAPKARPDEPLMTYGTPPVWYRGWECGWDDEHYFWTRIGWRAAKGGWDLDCKHTEAATWADLLDEIDAEEGDA